MSIISELMAGVQTAVLAGNGGYTNPFNSVDVKLVPVTPAPNRPMTMVVGYDESSQDRETRCTWVQTRTVRCIVSDFVGIGDIEAQTLERIETVQQVIEQVKTAANTISTSSGNFTLFSLRVDPEYSYEALLEESLFLSVIYLDYKGYT